MYLGFWDMICVEKTILQKCDFNTLHYAEVFLMPNKILPTMYMTSSSQFSLVG